MEIKKVLKNLDVRISKLARDLNISRPTLDTYIECYESGKPIPNSVYQEVFDYLFSSDNMNSIEFARRFDYVKRTILQDYKQDSAVTRDQTIRNKITDFAYDDSSDISLLEFINLFISNSNLPLVQDIYNYFNYVNGLKEYDETNIQEIDRALFSQLFKLFASYKDRTIEQDDDAYEDFRTKCNRIHDKKDITPTDEQLIEYVKSHVEGGRDLDIEYIKRLLAKED